jgi:hypothetical protein
VWIPGRLDIAPYRDALKDYISLIFQTVEDFFFKRAGAATRLTTRGRWSNDWLLHQARLRLRLVDNNNVSGAVGRHGEGGFRLVADVSPAFTNEYYRPKADRRTSGESANSHLHSACIIRLELISSSRCAMRAAIT